MMPFPVQAPYTTVRVTFETELHNEVLVIDLGAANGPFSQSADMSELGGKLIEPVTELLDRSEEHTSELQSLMRISYAVFCLKKNTFVTLKFYIHPLTNLYTLACYLHNFMLISAST